ncbi:putative methyltransferase-domain-containing protein [Polychytrium aggregatum]|uniref:putative methyltransferase-domain-containing protein n=1 Tax=Polychytrium aggregatum TaxID=110093 RepID=UPI0022FE00D5|nr:putative methyltransferase-domain-containing protein [Polychytrium aggregatum]KAI9209754.1 putative methyltransferase-domain-containing protein [Polychytrium aggregatum]
MLPARERWELKRKAREAAARLEQQDEPPKAPLLLTGPTWFSFSFQKPLRGGQSNGTPFTINGQPLYLESPSLEEPDRADMEHEVKTAYTVWDCSLVLSKFLEHHSRSQPDSRFNIQGKRLIELGSGRGLVGLSAARLGANVTLTDLNSVVPTLKGIVALNGLEAGKSRTKSEGAVEDVVSLDWNKPIKIGKEFDIVLAADVVWVEALIRPLAKTIAAFCRPKTIAICAHQSRSTRGDAIFFDALEELSLKVERLPKNLLHPDFTKETIDVYIFKRR